MKISQIGEFGLIGRIREMLGPAGPDVSIGPGDDTAGFATPPGFLELATCDVQVEGVHFLRDAAGPFDIGRKCVAVNVSDVAAMGGIPAYLLVSLGLPENTDVAFVDGLCQGMRDEAARFGARIIGGNLARNPERIFIDVFLLGRVEQGRALLRSGAKLGDRIAVTGCVGDSGAGLYMLLNKPDVPDAIRKPLMAAHLLPVPRVAEGRALSKNGHVNAAIDLSDGLVSDLGHICEESGVGARIWAGKVPVSAPCKKAAAMLNKDPLEWALSGGEDYELLFTIPEKHLPGLLEELSPKCPTPVTIIGEITQSGLEIVGPDGTLKPQGPGWNHFK